MYCFWHKDHSFILLPLEIDIFSLSEVSIAKFIFFSAIRPGDNCQYSSQCQRHDVEMICIQGICRCSLGKVFTGDICAESCPPGYIVGNNGICRQGYWKKLNVLEIF